MLFTLAELEAGQQIYSEGSQSGEGLMVDSALLTLRHRPALVNNTVKRICPVLLYNDWFSQVPDAQLTLKFCSYMEKGNTHFKHKDGV